MGCWTTLLILQAILGECNFHEDFADSGRELLDKVLKSVEAHVSGHDGAFPRRLSSQDCRRVC